LDRLDLERLAEHGLAAFFPPRLRDAAAYCWERGVATGDARHCLLSRSRETLAEAFDEDSGPLLTSVVQEVDKVLRRLLIDVLNAPTAEEGTWIASMLDQEIRAAFDTTP